ncbi:MAG: hypothetical protein ACOVO0_05730, partial [Burkholderiaceae bacterium]
MQRAQQMSAVSIHLYRQQDGAFPDVACTMTVQHPQNQCFFVVFQHIACGAGVEVSCLYRIGYGGSDLTVRLPLW